MVLQDFPAHFAKTLGSSDFRKGRKPDGRSDLYTYFYIRTLRLLNLKGIHTFVCSNAWLDAKYGAWLQEFLLHKVPMYFIVDNRAKRSFASSDINTVITVFSAPLEGTAKVPADHVVKFVAFRKPFEEVVYTENLLAIERAGAVEKTPDFRTFPKIYRQLLNEGAEESKGYIGNKWGGLYLRAPDIFHFILNHCDLIPFARKNKDPIVHTEGYVHDNYTGSQYPPVPFIKSIKEAKRIRLNPEDVYYFGVKESEKARRIADILFARTFGEDHLVLWNCARAIGKEFYKIFAIKAPARTLALYMNSTFFVLQRELFGTTGLGGGGLKFSMYDIEYFLFPESLIGKEIDFDGSEEFLDSEVKPIFLEIGIDPYRCDTSPEPLADRKKLDDVIFDALGLTEEQRSQVYESVCRLIWERTSKAKSTKKR